MTRLQIKRNQSSHNHIERNLLDVEETTLEVVAMDVECTVDQLLLTPGNGDWVDREVGEEGRGEELEETGRAEEAETVKTEEEEFKEEAEEAASETVFWAV